jgi:alpha-ketoglutarate-dependent taurine dioxygenase
MRSTRRCARGSPVCPRITRCVIRNRASATSPVGSSYGFHDEQPPLRPLVKIHPETGRAALYISRPRTEFPDSRPTIGSAARDLVAFACQPPRVYTHSWTPGDVVIWDNRCVLHRARAYDHREARVMMHVRVAGEPATELAKLIAAVRR